MSLYAPAFLCVFLPAAAGLNALLKSEKARNRLLLAAGLVFCAFGSLSGAAVLLASALVNFALGAAIARAERGRRALLAAGAALDAAVLFAYRYSGFLLGGVFGPAAAAWVGSAAVPLGISFFTFKCISYLADVYRDKSRAAESFSDLLLYISFFPQIIAGPITRFGDFAPQLASRSVGAENTALGFRRLIIGLAKKIFLVTALSRIVDFAFAADGAEIGTALAWLAAAAYTLQIFLDFSAYSDMAIGLGRMFGFSTPENFKSPYIADSIGEFWRRWHISLSSWFRDYVYIPLGGNRRGRAAAARNKLIVFTLCGLWHGAAWTFLLWGVWHGILSALETLNVIPVKRAREHGWSRVLLHVYTVLAVCLGFVLFRAATIGEAAKIFGAMFSLRAPAAASAAALHGFFGMKYIAVFVIGIVLCFPVGRALAGREEKCALLRPLSYVSALALLALCLLASASQGFQPFIYARF